MATMDMDDAIRILAVGDVGGSAEALRAVASRRPPLHVTGPVPADEAATTMRGDPAHVVLIGLPESDLPGWIGRLRVSDANVKVLVVGMSPHLATSVLTAGGCGVIAPDLSPDAIRGAIMRACAGELILDEEHLRALVERMADPRTAPGSRSLTPRETEVLRALAGGASTTEIAESLGISPMTVQSHVKNMLAKLGVHSKVEAVRFAWREGLATVPA
jgi:DNA-binding NarL/FixJ family response regulator